MLLTHKCFHLSQGQVLKKTFSLFIRRTHIFEASFHHRLCVWRLQWRSVKDYRLFAGMRPEKQHRDKKLLTQWMETLIYLHTTQVFHFHFCSSPVVVMANPQRTELNTGHGSEEWGHMRSAVLQASHAFFLNSQRHQVFVSFRLDKMSSVGQVMIIIYILILKEF